jgi:hypothetical protein
MKENRARAKVVWTRFFIGRLYWCWLLVVNLLAGLSHKSHGPKNHASGWTNQPPRPPAAGNHRYKRTQVHGLMTTA